MSKLSPGDFSGLSADYSKNRPNYSESVLNSLIGLQQTSLENLVIADIGAGTGIWTRMIYDLGVGRVDAVEPNTDMRQQGSIDNDKRNIVWSKGTAESTGLNSDTYDLVSMASSFHWANFESATKEFYRILKPQGRFVALWNPRFIEANPLLIEIEEKLKVLKPEIIRVSSGRSGITETLTQRLFESQFFEDVIYVEGRHEIVMSKERYIGAWRSVNDLQVQLGSDLFEEFISFIERKLLSAESIEATYLTRAWSARCTK